MPLVTCPDCGKRISDAAPACIGCGRPNAPAPQSNSTTAGAEPPDTSPRLSAIKERLAQRLKVAGEGLGSRLRSGWAATRKYAEAAAGSATGAASQGWVWTQEMGGTMVSQIQAAPTQIAGLIFRDCAIPTYLLPTGPTEKDFVCAFDFDQAVAEMKEGTLVRPRIVAWAGRSDVDRTRLALELKEQFSSQFRVRLQTVLANPDSPPLQHHSERVKALEQSVEKASSGIETAAKTLATGVGAMLLVANPLADLLFLAIALFGGTSVVSSVIDHLRSATDLRRARGALESDRDSLEKELELSNARFRDAVANIEIYVHPVLQEIVVEFSELEATPYLSSETAPDPPDVSARLAADGYREQVPEWFHPLLDRHTGRAESGT